MEEKGRIYSFPEEKIKVVIKSRVMLVTNGIIYT